MNAWWQTYPENVDAYRLTLLHEENRLRPWQEVLFCELRLPEESDDTLVSRLPLRALPYEEQDEGTAPASQPISGALHAVLRGLSPRAKAILLLHYRGTTQRAIAHRYGLSPQRVSQIIQDALHKVRKGRHDPRNQRLRSLTP